jgi:uncharacterized protein YeaO (DUF488 family)
MTDLTEQMHKGELPYAEYYIKLGGGEYTNDVWDIGGWQSFNKKGDVVVEVLAPVPSYDEWLEKTKSLKVLAEAYCKEKQKNTKLKEVLKEYKDITAIAMLYAKSDEEYKQAKTVREQIDEVLK